MARFVPSAPSSPAGNLDLHGAPQGFAVDSFNVHRLLIAGVTVASKFFSDVFYTNSRYAKVRSFLCALRLCRAHTHRSEDYR